MNYHRGSQFTRTRWHSSELQNLGILLTVIKVYNIADAVMLKVAVFEYSLYSNKNRTLARIYLHFLLVTIASVWTQGKAKMNVDFQDRHVVSNFYLYMTSCTLLSAAVKRQVQMKVIVMDFTSIGIDFSYASSWRLMILNQIFRGFHLGISEIIQRRYIHLSIRLFRLMSENQFEHKVTWHTNSIFLSIRRMCFHLRLSLNLFSWLS